MPFAASFSYFHLFKTNFIQGCLDSWVVSHLVLNIGMLRHAMGRESEPWWWQTLFNTNFIQYNLNKIWAVVVAQLVERTLPIPEVWGSNPVIGKNLFIYWTFVYCQLCIENTKIKKKAAGFGPFFKKTLIKFADDWIRTVDLYKLSHNRWSSLCLFVGSKALTVSAFLSLLSIKSTLLCQSISLSRLRKSPKIWLKSSAYSVANVNLSMAAVIAQWIQLRLPFCRLGF